MSGSEGGFSRDFLEGLHQGLAQQGLIEGRSVLLEARYANGEINRSDSIAVDLANSGVDLIFVGGDQGSWAAKRATDKVPIVAVTCDALASELVTNLRRPSGNISQA